MLVNPRKTQDENKNVKTSISYQWYEIQDNIAYYKEFEKPKIVYPDIAPTGYFILDETPKIRENFLRYKSIYVRKIPIPPAPETDKLIIKNLVQKCLDAKGQGVEEYEAEIDDRVAHLYGLTAEEMKVIDPP